MRKVLTALAVGLTYVFGVYGAAAQIDDPDSTSKSPAQVLREIEALKATNVAWRGIEWKACLLEGLRESSVQQKPVMLWIFIDRPFDDERC